MIKQNMKPVKKWHTNRVYTLEGCGDLPVLKLDDEIVSIWKLESIWERIKFLWHGEITFSVMGKTQPPISISCSDIVKQGK